MDLKKLDPIVLLLLEDSQPHSRVDILITTTGTLGMKELVHLQALDRYSTPVSPNVHAASATREQIGELLLCNWVVYIKSQERLNRHRC